MFDNNATDAVFTEENITFLAYFSFSSLNSNPKGVLFLISKLLRNYVFISAFINYHCYSTSSIVRWLGNKNKQESVFI